MSIEVAALRKVLGEVLPELPTDPAADLWEEGVMDSYAVVEVVSALEERFSITFAPDDLRQENFASLEAISRTLAAIRESS
ncbi:MAG: hypothetical protein IH878_03060 [Gemmatimonadetes bacterium]|nr:hypothetical protein [Gemmatimonadota bacterium]